MSRLDSAIRRLLAQRACLNQAAEMIGGIGGIVLELGLGNGRTYDHLRELFPDRDIYVCERKVAAHPDCVPPAEFLVLGDMRETLPGLRARFGGRVALAHFDAGTGDRPGNLTLAAELIPSIVPLLCRGGMLVSDPPVAAAELETLPLPDGISAGRYHLYRRL
jgi:S-adenosyl-L-methionine methyltransferase